MIYLKADSSLQFINHEMYTGYTAQGEFVVVAHQKPVCLVAPDGTVYKRLKSCVGFLENSVNLALDKVEGKREVKELSEAEWAQQIEVEAVTTP